MKYCKTFVTAAALTTTIAASANTYYVAPNGRDANEGTLTAPWSSIAHAQKIAAPGDVIYFRGGTYSYKTGTTSCESKTDTVSAVDLYKSGTSGRPIRYFSYPGETPVFNFSKMRDDCRIKGFNVTGSWIHLKGLELTGAPQNNNLNHESWGIWITGSHNVFEQLDTHHHMGPGLFIKNGSYNLVLNTDSHHNYDPLTSNGAGQSADGFGAHIAANNPGNIFRGCRAWWNSDDGFDLINAYSPVVIENSWAWLHGYLPGTLTPVHAGNGNGFKAGGYGGKFVANAPKHTVRFSVAFSNKASGFYTNHHPVANDFFNNTSYANGIDFNMLGVDTSGAQINLGNLRNNIAYVGTPVLNVSGANDAYNSWNLRVIMADSQFENVSTSGWDAPRQADGSLPKLNNLHLSMRSGFIGKGVDVGLPFKGTAPDLGAFERH